MGSKQGARERPIINLSGTLSYNRMTNMPRDKMNGNVVVRVFCHLYLTSIFLRVYHRWYKNFLTCKKGFPEIVHNTDSLKRGVLKGSSTIHENVQVTQKAVSNNKQLSSFWKNWWVTHLSRFPWLRWKSLGWKDKWSWKCCARTYLLAEQNVS